MTVSSTSSATDLVAVAADHSSHLREFYNQHFQRNKWLSNKRPFPDL